MQYPTSTKLLALALAGSLLIAWLPVAAQDPSASLAGRVRAGVAPLAGAQVFAANSETGQLIPATRTDDDGAFEIAALPGATYELAIETGGNLYVAEQPVPVPAGTRRQVEVRIHPELAAKGGEPGTKPAGRGLSRVWNNPLSAAFVVVGAAVVVGVLVDNATNDEDASPF